MLQQIDIQLPEEGDDPPDEVYWNAGGFNDDEDWVRIQDVHESDHEDLEEELALHGLDDWLHALGDNPDQPGRHHGHDGAGRARAGPDDNPNNEEIHHERKNHPLLNGEFFIVHAVPC